MLQQQQQRRAHYSDLEIVSRANQRKRLQTIASLLSASRFGATQSFLDRHSGEKKARPYIEALLDEGLISERYGSRENTFHITPQGSRFLRVFEELLRISALNSGRTQALQLQPAGYSTCNKCEPHPNYPDSHPVTLHTPDGKCVVCGS